MKTYSCILLISESGNFARLSTQTGRIIAEFLIDGCLAIAAYNAANNVPIEKGRVNIFRGELIQLARNERLDVKEEKIHNTEEEGVF